jgi:hypothetical protein
MSDRLTNDEVWARYPDEWVALQDPEVGPKDEILGGRVICHSKDRVEVHFEVRRRQPGDFAVFFTGNGSPFPVVL